MSSVHPSKQINAQSQQQSSRKRFEICSKLTGKTDSTPLSSVSIIDFEQVNVCWDGILHVLRIVSFKQWIAKVQFS